MLHSPRIADHALPFRLQVCFEVQPISVTPAQIAQGSYDLPSLQQAGATVYDISSDSVQALDSNGNPYPTYQIVSHTGRGGFFFFFFVLFLLF